MSDFKVEKKLGKLLLIDSFPITLIGFSENKLNRLKKKIYPDSNKNTQYHITLFNIFFNVNYVNFKDIKKIIKSVEFTKYINSEFKIWSLIQFNSWYNKFIH